MVDRAKDWWKSILERLDYFCIWTSPAAAMVSTISAVFATSKILEDVWQPSSPLWILFRDWLQGLMPTIFIVSTAVVVVTTLIRSLIGPTLRSSNIRVRQLEGEKALLVENFERLVKGYFVELASELDMPEHVSADRLSLYVSDDSRTTLVPVSRYSLNPAYNRKGRTKYPAHEGCIGKAWQTGWHFDDQFPDVQGNNDSEYVRYSQDKYSLPTETTRNFSMKPLCLAALAIPRKADHEHLAVLVFESIERNRFAEKRIKSLLDAQKPYLSNLVEHYLPIIALPSSAAQRGF